MKNLNNTAFTLLEILLAAIIFVITVSGVFATLSSVRQPVINQESALANALFGKQVLEDLRSYVSAAPAANFYESCTGNCIDFSLGLGQHVVPSASLPSDLSGTVAAASGSLDYLVSCADGLSDCQAGGANPDMARQVNGLSW